MSRQETTYEDLTQFRDFLTDYATAVLKSRQDAEDTVQDLYLRLWTRQEGIAEIRDPKAYCVTLLKNMCIDRLRAKQRNSESDMPEDVMDSERTDSRIENKEQLDEVVTAIGKLPSGQRTVLTQHIIEERDYDEIGKRTGMSGQTMRTQLSLARKALRRRFAWGIAVSAAVAFIIFLALPTGPKDSYSDPQLAYAELERTFEYISTKMNKGKDIARKAEPAFEKVERIMNNKKQQ